MKLSIIIPAFNSEKTINKSLEAVFNSDLKDFEVTVIDDASKDKTRDIVQKFPCRLICLERNSGPAYARDVGRRNAKYDVSVFIDSDIIINKDTLSKLVKYLELNPDVTAVTGILSKAHSNRNFFSQYKNLYMNYIFSKCPTNVDFLYGAFYAIRNKGFDICPTDIRIGEDSELGIMLARKGCKITLNKDLEVIHLKEYSFLSFIKNDFRVPYNWAKIFIQQKDWKSILSQKRFSHARISQILSILLSFAVLISILNSLPIALFFILAFLVLCFDFLLFLKKETGFLFMAAAIFITWLDMLIMGIGLIAGFISYFL